MESTREGMLDKRPETSRDDLPFSVRPSSGIHDSRIVNTYGTLSSDKIEKGRTLEKGTQEGAGALAAGTVQQTTISRPTVGTNDAWNGGGGPQPKAGGPSGQRHMSRPADDDDGSDTNTDATGGQAPSDGSDTSDQSADDGSSGSNSGSTARKASSSATSAKASKAKTS